MKLSEAIRIAVANEDAERVGRIADQLRAEGLSYSEIEDFARKYVPGLTHQQWEALLYDSED